MKKNLNLRNYVVEILFCAAIIVVIAVAFYVNHNFKLDSMLINNEEVMYLNDDWTAVYEMSDNETVSLPFTIREGSYRYVTVQRKLPADLPSVSSLCIETQHQNVMVSIDDTIVYEYWVPENIPFGETFGYMQHIVELPENSADKMVKITVHTPSTHEKSIMYSISYGSKGAIVFHIASKLWLIILSCLIGIAVSIFMFMLCIRSKKFKLYFNAGMFSLFVTVWIFTDTTLPQFFYANQAVCYIVSFCVFMLMPVPFFLFLKEAGTQRRIKTMNTICIIHTILFLMVMILYMTNTVMLYESITVVHIAIIVTMLYSAILFIYDSKRSGKSEYNYLTAAVIVLLVFTIIQIFVYNNEPLFSYSQYFRMGLVLFAVIIGSMAYSKSQRGFATDIEVHVLEKMAFIDSLTGLSNRAIFELDKGRLNDSLDEYTSVGFVVLDLDGLKQANDKYGHARGDDLIIAAARCIAYAFEKLGKVYRIGGDEFVVILNNPSEEYVEHAITIMSENVDIYNGTAVSALGISCGYAIKSIGTSQRVNIDNIFDEADRLMYANKIQNKQGRQC